MIKVGEVLVLVDWSKFSQGASFFIPCLDPVPVLKELNSEIKRLKLSVTIKQVIENKQCGLRVWRN